MLAMLENIATERRKDKVFFTTLMDPSTRAHGMMTSDPGMEHTHTPMVTPLKANGSIMSEKDMDRIRMPQLERRFDWTFPHPF